MSAWGGGGEVLPPLQLLTSDGGGGETGGRFRIDQKKDFVIQRIINLWGLISPDVVMASSFDGFKRGH